VFPEGFDLANLNEEQVDLIDYLTYFVKEALWMDAPISASFTKLVHEDLKIEDIVIKKGTDIWIAIFTIHYNSKQWQSPYEFNPERFDPESKYFLKPDGGKRSQYAFLPFGAGPWVCPG